MNRDENMKGRAGPKIGCINCNELGDKTKRIKVLTWLKGKPENTLPLIPLSCFFEIRETVKFFDRPREQMHLGYSAIQE